MSNQDAFHRGKKYFFSHCLIYYYKNNKFNETQNWSYIVAEDPSEYVHQVKNKSNTSSLTHWEKQNNKEMFWNVHISFYFHSNDVTAY